MHFLELTLPTLAENLALDEALLLEAEESGGEVLRLSEWPQPAVVLGAGCRLGQAVDEAACKRDGVPILRRSSGGGTVLLGPGCLIYSLILSYDREPALAEVRPSYAYILGQIRDALGELVPGIEHAGTSDLAIGGRKFSGNAQQRKRTHLLHHGTLLYAFDATLVERYLCMPDRQPDYRARRRHDEFLVNLAVNQARLCEILRSLWNAASEVTDWPRQRAQMLHDEKYTLAEWLYRR